MRWALIRFTGHSDSNGWGRSLPDGSRVIKQQQYILIPWQENSILLVTNCLTAHTHAHTHTHTHVHTHTHTHTHTCTHAHTLRWELNFNQYWSKWSTSGAKSGWFGLVIGFSIWTFWTKFGWFSSFLFLIGFSIWTFWTKFGWFSSIRPELVDSNGPVLVEMWHANSN